MPINQVYVNIFYLYASICLLRNVTNFPVSVALYGRQSYLTYAQQYLFALAVRLPVNSPDNFTAFRRSVCRIYQQN